MSIRLTFAASAIALLAGAAVAQTPASQAAAQTAPAMPAPAASGDIIATAQAAGQFSTLLKAAEETGLTPVLKGAGPLTVFAHANTGDDLSDHTAHVIWFGPSEPLDLSQFH